MNAAMIDQMPAGLSRSDIRRMVVSDVAKALRAEQLSLGDYIRKGWTIIDPTHPLVEAYYIDLIAEHLEAVSLGQILRLLINIEPRTGKSNEVSILWPTWDWTRRPGRRFINASYSQRLSITHSLGRRRLIESTWYQKNWGHMVRIRDDQDQKTEFENTARGKMFATSVGGTATGVGADIIIADDVLNPKQADSDLKREAMHDFFGGTLLSRLDDRNRGAIVVVEQRLHPDDLSGRLLKDKGWVHLCLPAAAPKRTIIVFPISKREIVREQGDVLCPERMSSEQFEKMNLVPRVRAAQYQQNPTTEEGDLFKRAWWKTWKVLPSDFDEIILSWDMTFKDSDGTDFVVGQVWGRRDAQFFLIDQVRARMDYPTTRGAVVRLAYKHPQAYAKLIEEKANGAAIISDLKTQITGLIPIIPKESKLARAQAVAPLAMAGNVYLPHPEVAPWVSDFVEELAAFPLGDNDDQVDAASQALSWLADRANRRPAAASVGGLTTRESQPHRESADWMR